MYCFLYLPLFLRLLFVQNSLYNHDNLEKESGRLITFDGLDGTGKSTLIGMFRQKNVETIDSPPNWMKPFRQSFDDSGLESRFLFYANGNVWVDKNIIRPKVSNGETVLLDRSWLSTLAAHELRGLSGEFLEMGFDLARKCTKPEMCYIIHVEKEERKKRLVHRLNINETDKQNMAYENSMEPSYKKWAGLLDWNITIFENSQLTPNEAFEQLSDLILRK